MSLINIHWPLADMLFSFHESNVAGKVIVLLLFAGSIYAWTIMVNKYVELRRASESSLQFLRAFRKHRDPLTLYLREQSFGASPLFAIYAKACDALGAELETMGHNADELFRTAAETDTNQLTPHQFEVLRNVTQRNVADRSLLMERRMNILATAVNASPFLGLLGTVWGVMEAFTAMALVGQATLSAVAPGIAAALLTTVMGLLVALPSAIGYNLLSGKISELQVQTHNFAQELIDKIQTQFLQTR